MYVLLIGGGTLGSVTPLLAVAEELRARSDALHDSRSTLHLEWWGTRHGPERQLVEAAGVSFRAIPAGKLRRYWDVRNVFDVAVIVWALMRSLTLLMRERPSIVIGAGSFVQVPVLWSAWLLRIPFHIHQLDVRPSLANLLVARGARSVSCAFSESAARFGERATVIGIPVRSAILTARDRDPHAARERFGCAEGRPVILILGGGTGAAAMNELVWDALPTLTRFSDVIHAVGRGKGVDTIARPHYHPFEFLSDNLPDAYAAADLVVSRAGMGTLAELGALGRACALIPLPGTHQEENARVLESRGAVAVWDQHTLTPESFAARIQSLLEDIEQRTRLSRTFARVFPSDAAERLVERLR